MITLTLEAKDIPEYTKVRKVTGEKLYTLRRTDTMKVYGAEESQIYFAPGILLLVAEQGSMNVIPSTLKLSIDLEIADAVEFLSRMAFGED
jgi:hypothetical protein